MKFSVVKLRFLWYAISGVSIGLSIAFLAMWGLKQGLEFTGGSLLAMRFSQPPSVADAERAIGDANLDFGSIIIQPVGDKDIQFRTRNLTEEEHQKVVEALKNKFGSAIELRFDAIGPVIGEELRQKSIRGLALVLLGILVYVAYSFRKVAAPVQSWKYGIITIITAFHDVVIPMGVFAWLGHYRGVEIGTAFIAAILTILGYSITDTIVVLDRVRENLQKRSGSFAELVDVSVRQTFLRSFNTSATTLLTLAAIHFFGGESLKDFTLTLMIGIAVGTYSSIFIASPLLVTWNNWARKK